MRSGGGAGPGRSPGGPTGSSPRTSARLSDRPRRTGNRPERSACLRPGGSGPLVHELHSGLARSLPLGPRRSWSPDGARLATIVDGVLSLIDTPLGPGGEARRRRSPSSLVPTTSRGAPTVRRSPSRARAVSSSSGCATPRRFDCATFGSANPLLGLVDDGHGRFLWRQRLSARVVKQPVTGSAGPPRATRARPDLLARFLGNGALNPA